MFELYFRFFVSENVWKYRVAITNCKIDNGKKSSCPVFIMARGGSYPSPGIPGSHVIHCNKDGAYCRLEVVSPLLRSWHYLAILQDIPSNITNVTFMLQVNTFGECIYILTIT